MFNFFHKIGAALAFIAFVFWYGWSKGSAKHKARAKKAEAKTEAVIKQRDDDNQNQEEEKAEIAEAKKQAEETKDDRTNSPNSFTNSDW